MGEAIPLDLTFTSTVREKYHIDMAGYDRSGRMTSESFALEPSDGWSDPLTEYFNSGLFSFMGGGLRTIPELGPDPKVMTLDLNEWVRFERPGHYRLTVTSSRVIAGKDAENPAGIHVPVSSNPVEFEILPANADWSSEIAATALAGLNSEDGERRLRAARALRFAGTDPAISAMVQRFRGDDFDAQYMFGLLGAPNRKLAVQLLEEGLADPRHPITPTYLRTLAVLAYRLDHPEPLPPAPTFHGGENETQIQDWEAATKERRQALRTYVERYLTILAGSVQARRGRELGEALSTILVEGAEAGLLKQPAFVRRLEQLRADMPALFLQLPEGARGSLLAFWWSYLRSAEMLPVLSALYDRTPNFTRGTYLNLIADLDPKAARELVLQDMRRKQPTLLYDEIRFLGEELLPAMDDALASRLEQAARENSPLLSTFAKLIQRHATGAIAPRVESAYSGLRQVEADCTIRGQLMAYFLRADFEFGRAALAKEQALPERDGSVGCAEIALATALPRDLPKVEELVFAELRSGDPRLVATAAAALRRGGSAATEEHLWEALRRWHSRWYNRADELRRPDDAQPSNAGNSTKAGKGSTGMIFCGSSSLRPGAKPEAIAGYELSDAIACGNGWLADGDKLAKLRALCVTQEQCERVEGYQAGWKTVPVVEIIVFDHEQVWPHFAQYEMQSLDSLWPKLKQWPKGTTLTCEPQFGPDQADHAESVVSEIQKFAQANGIVLNVRSEAGN